MADQQSAEIMTIAGYARRFMSKAVAAMICAGGLAWVMYQLMLEDAARGKEAYIADQVSYFEQTLSPPTLAVPIIYVVLVCFFLFLYEVLSLGIYLLIRARRK